MIRIRAVCFQFQFRGKDKANAHLDKSFVFEPPALLEPFDVDINLLQACEGPASGLAPVIVDGSPVQRSRCPDMRPFLRDRPQSGHSTTRLAVVRWVTCWLVEKWKKREGERAHGQWGRQLPAAAAAILVPDLAGVSSVASRACAPPASPRGSRYQSSRLRTFRV